MIIDLRTNRETYEVMFGIILIVTAFLLSAFNLINFDDVLIFLGGMYVSLLILDKEKKKK